MRVILERHSDRAPASMLVVVLPGAMQEPEDLLSAGFADAIRARGLPVDLALVGFGLRFIGETGDGTVVRQLHDMLREQVALHDYQHIWIAGISIGGTIATAYVDTYVDTHRSANGNENGHAGVGAGAGRIRGLCLLAPYPGNRMVTAAIRKAGGLAHWSPAQSGDMDDGAFRLWRWLKHHRRTGPLLFLGYGTEDRFEPGLALMAEAVEANCVATISGGHDMPVWRRLWESFLDRLAPPSEQNMESS